MANFNIGDSVRLKSGGPKMTVSKLFPHGDQRFQCQWFSGSKLQEGWFSADALELYQDDKPAKK